jgi:diaminopimelate epimerase
VQFFKYEGLGNDFVVVDASDDLAVTPERAVAICDRRFGVGADGVLLVLPPRAERAKAGEACDVRMRVINADGSIPEMCGNGVRCVAVHVARARGLREGTVRVDSDAGVIPCAVNDAHDEGIVTVDMGVIRLFGDRTLDIGGKRVTFSVADAGNPHAVLFGTFARGDVDHLGPRLATHPDFPRGTNVEFSHIAGDGIDLIVWERGVGITLACGTGACATAAVAVAKGFVAKGHPIPVRLPGGRLDITIDDAGHAIMRGPARFVFSGVLST